MTATQIVVSVLVLLAVAAVVVLLLRQRRTSQHLRSTFGPEYDRTVEDSGRRRDAERDLAAREEHRRALDVRPLPARDREAFAERWRSTQADFVDHPQAAVRSADGLVTEVLGRRGYPVGDVEQMSRDVSVDHPDAVHDYRAAHEALQLGERGQASTEQLRQAMVHYRALFTELLGDGAAADSDGARPVPADGSGSEADGREDRTGGDGAAGRHDVPTERDGLVRGRGGAAAERDLPDQERPRA